MHPSVRPSPLYDFSQEHDACGVGFIARTDGARTHDVLKYALTALKGLAHRGAIDADSSTGDGAGVMTQLPYELLRAHLESTRASAVPRDRDLAVGMLFLPRGDDLVQAQIKKIVIEAVKEEGLGFVAWRDVPVDVATLGRKAAETRPAIVQAIVARVDDSTDDEFERHCYLAQKVAERRCADARLDGFYVCSFSPRTIVYKGLLNAPEVRRFFPDLRDPRFQTAFAIFHQRYSTNTFPTWHLAQPFRLLAHNGEINTIRGNRVRMTARERAMAGGVWGTRFGDLHPVIQPGMSDSASFDNVLQVLTLGGRSALHSMMMMAPLAWEQNPRLSEEARGFFKYHSLLLEPWDGPAALVFSDGRVVAATLDRNGLRPARYKIYDDGYVILASEHGLVDLPGQVVSTGRLAPGRMIAVDLQERRLLMDEDIKREICEQPRWRDWCDKHLINLQQFAATAPAAEFIEPPAAFSASLLQQQLAHGYDAEEQELILTPLAEGLEPTGSMGDDTPLAVLSRKPRLLYTYFKQLFAQVTNPPIDSIREKSVMSLGASLGPRMGLFDTALATSGVLTLDSPILLDHEVAALFSVPFFRNGVVRLRAHFDIAAGPDALGTAVRDLALRAEAAVEQGAKLVLVSDRGLAPDKAAIPMLLAVGAVQHQLIRAGLRFKCDVVAETAEAREVHHIACLVGFGANAVNPYLALASVRELAAKKKLPSPLAPADAEHNYKKSIEAGLLKVMARMGISTLASYRGAQIFEAIGLGHKVVEECFAGTPSPIGGIGYRQIAEETLRRHERAFPRTSGAASEAEALAAAATSADLPNEGYYKVAKKGDGEFHGWNPKVVAGMHKFLKGGATDDYKVFAQTADEHQPVTLKDLLKLRFPERSLPLDEVEPVEDIRRRFTTAGMSLGALSPEAHETLALAMNRIGGKSNSGEGGEDPARFGLRENGDSANSAIKQVASGRFGVTAEYLANAREIEIKMAQGAKPGEGGQLPGHKVSPLIARLRFSVPGVTLISPPPHHDIYSIEDLAQLIFDLKEVNPRAKVCVKLVACSGVGTIAAGVAKAYADVVLVSGHEGGTGASPLGSIKNAGSDWVLGVAEAHQVLMMNGLRNRVTLRTDGGMKTGRDIVIAAILGAEEFNFGTAALIAAGCAMFRVCHQNTCPVGVATQRDDLRAKFRGKPENVIAYFNAVAEEVRHYLARLGAHTLDDIIGRPELLEQIDDPANPKTRFLNLSGVLHNVDPTGQLDRIHTRERNERFPEGSLDETILQDARHVIAGRAGRFTGRYKVGNTNRCVGTHLSGQIAYLRGSHHPLAPRTLDLDLHGTAGQSFGTFLVQGVRLTLTGEANDYVGKGMSGGEIVIRPRADEVFPWETNTIIGNTCLYGATGGTLFAAGWAGERFAVRNSGATAVVEGCGDHGCEYMTRGAVVVLGRVGLNFGAGMSGGLAFLHDDRNVVPQRVNPAMLKLERVTDADEGESLRSLVAAHAEATGSPHAQRLLADWPATLAKFWKVIPNPPSADTPKPVYRYEPAVPAPAPELAFAS